MAGEDKDMSAGRGGYMLTETEKSNLALIRRHFKRVILLLNTCGIIDMSEINSIAPDAILMLWTGGMLGASAAALLNALKTLAGIDKEVKLISPEVIEPIQNLKTNHFGNHNPRLHTDEALIALSFCATTDEAAKKALDQLTNLKGGEAHSSVILSQIDSSVFKKLGLTLTCEPVYQAKKLYHG
jgi:uncharacterized protein (UPF0371 family)